MTEQLPQVTRTYQNFVLDSTRWQHYQPRADDIIISTSYKSGTTWTQEIVRQLIFGGQDVPERDDILYAVHRPGRANAFDGRKAPLHRFWHMDAYETRNGRWQVIWSQATESQ